MVDIATYKKMHPDALISSSKMRDDMGTEEMTLDRPSRNEDLLLMPAKIRIQHERKEKGLLYKVPMIMYKLMKSLAVNILVDEITAINWNKKAFDNLVVDPDTKELIEALVTNQLDMEKSTDLISGKGNGLIILLHG